MRHEPAEDYCWWCGSTDCTEECFYDPSSTVVSDPDAKAEWILVQGNWTRITTQSDPEGLSGDGHGDRLDVTHLPETGIRQLKE